MNLKFTKLANLKQFTVRQIVKARYLNFNTKEEFEIPTTGASYKVLLYIDSPMFSAKEELGDYEGWKVDVTKAQIEGIFGAATKGMKSDIEDGIFLVSDNGKTGYDKVYFFNMSGRDGEEEAESKQEEDEELER